MFIYTHSRWGHCGGTGNFANEEFQPNNNGGTPVLPQVWCVGDHGSRTSGADGYEDYFDEQLNLMNQYGGFLGYNAYESGTVGFNWAIGDQNVCYLGTTVFYTESGSQTLPV